MSRKIAFTVFSVLALTGCGDPTPPPEPCVRVTAKVFLQYGMLNDKWDGPHTHTVCVVSVDGKPYRGPQ